MKKLILLLICLFFLFPPPVFAQSTVSSNCALTSIGDNAKPGTDLPGACGSNNSLVQAALATVDWVYGSDGSNGHCPPTGQVNQGNYSCLQNGLPALFQNTTNRQKADAQFTASVNYAYALQCIGFVQGVVSGIYGQPLEHYDAASGRVDEFGDAVTFYTSIPGGYTFINKQNSDSSYNVIQPGDIPVWDDGSHGHIAIAVALQADVSFTVAEANWGPPGLVHTRVVSYKGDSNLKGWLRKNS